MNTDTACVWGTSSNPVGNWSPYVAGANTDDSGNTFVKIGWNPIYLEPATPFRNQAPNFGVEIVCEGEGCNGLPCKIDPAVHAVNEMEGSSTDGAGGAAFCVVTVPSGNKANIVVFEGSSSGSSSSSSSSAPASSSSSSSSSTSSSSSSSSSTSSAPTTTSTSIHSSSVSSTSSSSSSSKSKATPSSSSVGYHSTPASYSYAPHVFIENPSSVAASSPTQAASVATPSPSQTSHKGAAPVSAVSMLGVTLTVLGACILLNF
jgi:hypothetical protein